MKIEVTAKDPIVPYARGWEILPRKYGVTHENVENGKIRFTIDHPMKLTLVRLGDYTERVMHLFTNAPEKDVPRKDDPNVIFFGPGYYDTGPDKNWIIELKDNQVRNITLDNVTIDGTKVTRDSRYLKVNEYVEGLQFK